MDDSQVKISDQVPAPGTEAKPAAGPRPLVVVHRKALWNTAAAVLLAGLLFYGLTVFFHVGEKQYTEDAQVEEYVSPVSSKVSGFLREIRFEEHQKVHRGDTLAVIDDREFKIALLQAQAALRQAQAGNVLAHSEISLAENSTSVSDANLEEMRARLENQRRNLQRYANLLKGDVVPQSEYDQVKTEYQAMEAHYTSLVRQRQSARINAGSVSDKAEVSEGDIMKGKAAVELAKLNLSYCYILAPYDGVVGRRRIEEGQLVQPGQTLTTIVENGRKWVTANYTESQIGSIHPGDRVRLRVDAVKKVEFTGVVTAISEATGSRYSATPVDNSTGNFVKVQQRIPVRIDFTGKNSRLGDVRAGMNVQVTRL